MEEIKKHEAGNAHPTEDGQSAFNFQIIYTTLILNWKWFILSIIICLGIAAIYLRYTTPVYMANAKLLIKDEEGRGRTNIRTATNLGIISNSEGIENEMEILKSRSIATQAVRDLKLYTTYRGQGKITDKLIYKTQPITVDIDPA
ncbi:MAG: Wzz/FepE/Etk N-terminal domain-containing protein, partial [Prevotella sp.]|nr:Wzz/FepE/Etk N-terminal domain-containing protein [Prevotella sp.]